MYLLLFDPNLTYKNVERKKNENKCCERNIPRYNCIKPKIRKKKNKSKQKPKQQNVSFSVEKKCVKEYN